MKAAEVFREIIDLIGDEFTDKNKLPDAYDLENNASTLLRNGWGIRIGSESPFSNQEFCNKTNTREFEIVFTRELISTESDDREPDDVGILLIDDVARIQKIIASPDRMNIDGVDSSEINNSSEVGTVISSKRKFLTISASFSITISEKH